MQKRRKSVRIFMNLLPVLLALVTFLLVEKGSDYPQLIEKWYSKGLYPFAAWILSGFSHLFPFSVWDVFWSIVVLILLYAFGLLLTGKLRLVNFLDKHILG